MNGTVRAEARIDLDAVAANAAALRERVGSAGVMAVVKADAYGHGAVECARAALASGATWLGTALPEEALALRAAGLTAPVLTWLAPPGTDYRPLVAAGIDVSVSADWALDGCAAAARETGRPARVHLKIDTGLGRNGCPPREWAGLLDRVARVAAEGAVEVVGAWTHLACADEPGHPANEAQLAAFEEALAVAAAAGVEPPLRHAANSPAALSLPAAHYDLVRVGLALYGLSPFPGVPPTEFGLTPAMTLTARLAMVKRVPAGHGVSYGHTWSAPAETTLGLVPLGYADGVPRHGSGVLPVLVGGERRHAVGRVAMDQFVVDLGPASTVRPGDEVVLLGPGDRGEPTAEEWAELVGTNNYEVVTRISPRVPRVFVGGAGAPGGPGADTIPTTLGDGVGTREGTRA